MSRNDQCLSQAFDGWMFRKLSCAQRVTIVPTPSVTVTPGALVAMNNGGK